MTQLSSQASQGVPVTVKPRANVYTVLVIVAVLALGVTLGVACWYLMAARADGGCGWTFGQLLGPLVDPS